jgi:hypothetical protein
VVPPSVAVGQLRALAGRWIRQPPARDYFVFRANGRGAWVVAGRALWKGQALPAGENAFRLPWQVTGPQKAAYWHLTLVAGGTRLLFDGTGQQYRKVTTASPPR